MAAASVKRSMVIGVIFGAKEGNRATMVRVGFEPETSTWKGRFHNVTFSYIRYLGYSSHLIHGEKRIIFSLRYTA